MPFYLETRLYFFNAYLASKGQHAVGRQKLEPQLPRLLVRPQPLLLVPPKIRRIQPRRVQAKLINQAFPRPGNRLLLEVRAKAPVPQHLKKGVVVRVLPYVLQVIMLPPRPNALLAIHRPGQLRQRHLRVGRAQKKGLELVHPRVGEEEGGVVMRHHGAGRPVGVLSLLDEVVDESLSHASGRPSCFVMRRKSEQDVRGAVARRKGGGWDMHAPEGSLMMMFEVLSVKPMPSFCCTNDQKAGQT